MMRKAFCVHSDSKSTSHLTRMKIFLFYYFLCTVSDVASVLVEPLPQNKAVVNGATRVAFNCTSPYGFGFINWYFVPVGGPTSIFIANGGNLAPVYVNVYEVSNAGDLTSTLTIKTVNESLAGTYFCSEGAAATASAQLIVYNVGPVCTSNVNSGQNLNQGQSVQMSCSFSYTANYSYVGVNMVWSKVNPSSPVQSPSPVITTTGTLTTAVSTITQTVGYSSPFPVYQCQTSFKVTGTTATNDPGYTVTRQPFNSPINVLYFNSNYCSINGAKSGDRVYYGTSISCQADANPPPIYKWSYGSTSAILSDTATVQITSDGQYICTASNNVGRCMQSIDLTTYGSCDGLTFKPFVMIFASLASIAIQSFLGC